VRKSTEDVVRILRQCLERGGSVEIEGLGIFRNKSGHYEFTASQRRKVFIAYVQEDLAAAERLYREFLRRGFDPWLDRMRLLPGQNWPRAIAGAIEMSDFFVACLSGRALAKKGQFQAELRYALDCARRLPMDTVYFVPVRLEECAVPARIQSEIQYVDVFPDWEEGVHRLLAALRRPAKRRSRLRLAG